MDENLNNRQNEVLWKLLANPADNGHAYADNLQTLVDEFPQSGLLRAMRARAGGGESISHAAAYFNPRALYILVNSSDSLAMVPGTQIIGNAVDYPITEQPEQLIEEEQTPVTVVAEDERLEVESIDQIVNAEQDLTEPVQEEVGESSAAGTETIIDAHVHQGEISEANHDEVSEFVFDETEPLIEERGNDNSDDAEPIIINSENKDFYEDELVTEAGGLEEEQAEDDNVQIMPADENRNEDAIIDEPVAEHPEPQKDIDDDIYDEIVGIDDINFTRAFNPVNEGRISEDAIAGEGVVPHEETNEKEHKDRALNLDDEAEKLIVGNIAATDYFVFDRAISESKAVEINESGPAAGIAAIATEHQEVSKYHDDKMPYTFMWWLDKTRKEHAGIYQPFKLDTSQAIRQSGAQELQQQYYENIFHLNSVEELNRGTSSQTVQFDTKNKEDRLIKKFIVEEPHINPPSSDKLDNENKARKSAEDQDELVTETLARIYSDQMLYHKAIITYKKLMLKFPEKSRYFADQIEQLERKTN